MTSFNLNDLVDLFRNNINRIMAIVTAGATISSPLGRVIRPVLEQRIGTMIDDLLTSNMSINDASVSSIIIRHIGYLKDDPKIIADSFQPANLSTFDLMEDCPLKYMGETMCIYLAMLDEMVFPPLFTPLFSGLLIADSKALKHLMYSVLGELRDSDLINKSEESRLMKVLSERSSEIFSLCPQYNNSYFAGDVVETIIPIIAEELKK